MRQPPQRPSGQSADRHARWLLAAPPYAFLLVFFLAPALAMLLASFRWPGEFGGLAPLAGADMAHRFTLENWRFLAHGAIFAEILLRSVLVALATTILCLLLAYPLALLIARRPRRQREWMVLLVMLPFASNFLIRVYAWIIILGPLNLLYTPVAVMLGMVYVHLPFMVLPLYANLEQHDPALLDAASDLGAGPWQRFWRITLPLSAPGMLAGGALVFIPVLGMFAIPELLGGTGDVMIGNLIKEQFLESRDWPLGAALALTLTGIALGMAQWSAHLARRKEPS